MCKSLYLCFNAVFIALCCNMCSCLCLQGTGGGRASGARSGDEEEKIQQQRQMCLTVRREKGLVQKTQLLLLSL